MKGSAAMTDPHHVNHKLDYYLGLLPRIWYADYSKATRKKIRRIDPSLAHVIEAIAKERGR